MGALPEPLFGELAKYDYNKRSIEIIDTFDAAVAQLRFSGYGAIDITIEAEKGL